MSRTKRIKTLINILEEITVDIKKLFQFSKEEKDKELKSTIIDVVTAYASINHSFYDYLIKKTIKSYKQDLVDIQFEDIIKDLKKNDK